MNSYETNPINCCEAILSFNIKFLDQTSQHNIVTLDWAVRSLSGSVMIFYGKCHVMWRGVSSYVAGSVIIWRAESLVTMIWVQTSICSSPDALWMMTWWSVGGNKGDLKNPPPVLVLVLVVSTERNINICFSGWKEGMGTKKSPCRDDYITYKSNDFLRKKISQGIKRFSMCFNCLVVNATLENSDPSVTIHSELILALFFTISTLIVEGWRLPSSLVFLVRQTL